MKHNKAVIFGATGLVGNALLQLVLNDSFFNHIIVATRAPLSFKHQKMTVCHIDFSNFEEIEKCIKESSVVFSAIGTTQQKVQGDKKKYRKIDFDITYNIGRACKNNNIEKFLFVSTSGADASSASFYLKLKGEIEDSVCSLNLNSLTIFQPSLLLGERSEFRFWEKIAQIIMPLFSFFLPANIKPISSQSVSEVMVHFAKMKNKGNNIIKNREQLMISKKVNL